jgi:toxin ParE1/3/4
LIVRAIRRTERADEDLIAIWSNIAADSPASADRTLDAIEERWRQLARFPFSGRARDDIASGVRCLVVGSYLTLYSIGDEAITILRVLHGRRKIGGKSVEELGKVR